MKAIYIIMILAVVGIGIYLTNYLTGGGGGVPDPETRAVYVYTRVHAGWACLLAGTEIQDVLVKSEPFCMGDTSTTGDILVSVTGPDVYSVAKKGCDCGWGCDTIVTFKFCLRQGNYNIRATWRGTSDTEEVTVT